MPTADVRAGISVAPLAGDYPAVAVRLSNGKHLYFDFNAPSKGSISSQEKVRFLFDSSSEMNRVRGPEVITDSQISGLLDDTRSHLTNDEALHAKESSVLREEASISVPQRLYAAL
jgi:hypothetical protein